MHTILGESFRFQRDFEKQGVSLDSMDVEQFSSENSITSYLFKYMYFLYNIVF